MTPAPPPDSRPGRKPRDWAPRLWGGGDFFTWLRLLARNRFAVEPPYWYMAAVASGVSFAHSVLGWLQHGMYGDRIARTRIDPPPIFVIGHWRTGTTLLHELLILDPRHGSPTTLHCFDPCCFLLTERFMKSVLWFAVPEKRPMDNMAAGWDRPQEDEFALALLGEPSTYTDVAFPNRPPLDPGALDLSGLAPRELARWKRTLVRFLKTVQFRDPRRLVLKSPPHTARVRVLLDLFPGAKFVHIVRDPYTVFPSTVNLWTSFGKKHGFQTPRDNTAAVEAKVFREFRVIHDRLEADKRLIPAGNFTEVRYEELVRDMPGGMKRVYDALGLGGYEAVRPAVEAFAAGSRGYETNKWDLTPEARARVRAEWGDITDRLGYGGG